MNPILLENYYFSGWIENFGVEPLFLSAAFLLVPIFLSFNFLLRLVTCVLEAILISLFRLINQLKKQRLFLTFSRKSVKEFLQLLTLFHLFISTALGTTKQLFLAKGEQEIINIKDLKSFSIGNSEVISAKYQAAHSKLLIKSKMVGFSDLVIWETNGHKTKYEIFTSSKLDQAKNLRMVTTLKANGLDPIQHPSGVILRGEIKNFIQYSLVQTAQKFKHWSINVELGPEFRNKLIGKIYSMLLTGGATYVTCQTFNLILQCTYRGEVDGAILTEIKNRYQVNFQNPQELQNFKISFQIIQIDRSQSSYSKLGVDQISLKLHNALNSSLVDLDQFFKLSANKFNGKVIASPMSIIGVNEQSQLELGSSIPFQSQTQFGATTQWRFAGLKIQSQIQRHGEKLSLNYQTELSRPVGESISGSKASGKIEIKLNHFVKVFEITYENSDEGQDSIPGLGDIPILKHLFSANQNSSGMRHIIGYIKIEGV